MVGIAELKDESSVNVESEVISHTFVPVEPLSRPDKGFCSVLNDGETGLDIEEYKGKIKLNKKSSEVCNEALSLERCAHRTCSNTINIDECESCTDEIDTGMIGKKISVYSTSNVHGEGEFARETSPEVCKFETVSRSSKNTNRCAYHSVGAVTTRSMRKEASLRERPKAELSGISSDNDNDELVLEQRNDSTISLIIKWKENNSKPSWAEVSKYSPVEKYYWNRLDSFEIKDGVLCRKWENNTGNNITWQIVIPQKLRPSILQQLHNSVTGGHLGIKKTLSKVRQRYFWYGLRKFVEQWCRTCDICASKKSPSQRPKAPMKQYNVGAPMERIALDIMGPFNRSNAGNKYILVIADYFTKFTHAVPIRNQEADTVARKLVDTFIAFFGVPLQIHTDQGTNFQSNMFKEMCELLGIEKTRSTVMRPQSDGMVERHMRTLQSMISSFTSTRQRDWDIHIPLLMMAYRSSTHETTGVTPCCMMFGREINLPVDLMFGKTPENNELGTHEYVRELENKISVIHEFARFHMNVSSDTMKRGYDHKIYFKLYNRGDPVWFYQYQRKVGINPKFQRPWHGPYVVTDRINDVLYRIQLGPKSQPKVVHHDKLKPYVGENGPMWFS